MVNMSPHCSKSEADYPVEAPNAGFSDLLTGDYVLNMRSSFVERRGWK